MKYEVKFTSQFKKDLKQAKKQNKNLDELWNVVNTLASGGILEAKYRDHPLTGNSKGTRECCRTSRYFQLSEQIQTKLYANRGAVK